MYGILIHSIVQYITERFGEGIWLQIKAAADVQQVTFSTHERYSENLIPSIGAAAAKITGIEYDSLMDAFGVAFVSYVGRYGYDRILKVLGRHMSEFLNGLDNLHEYLRFSYPKLRPPSFFVENETSSGLTLHYRSKRKGFVHYVKGQIRQVGHLFYSTIVNIDIVSVDESEHMVHVVFKLHFDNTAYKVNVQLKHNLHDDMHIRSDVFFDLFPFHIAFNEDMVIRSAGQALQFVIPSIVGKSITDVFQIDLPLVHFSWTNILAYTNNSFELRSREPVSRQKAENQAEPEEGQDKKETKPHNSESLLCQTETVKVTVSIEGEPHEEEVEPEEAGHFLRLKGQMMFMDAWQAIVFLGTPVMESLDAMFQTGLYINDLSMHDSSRDLVLAGTQQSAELKLALDQEQQKSRILEESMLKLDTEMRRTDQLLYQMIPKPVADRLRRGEPAINTCEVFDNVTILFSDVVGFTRICSVISPMEVVSMLNEMYTKFDHLTETHGVYKVETIGDAYMVVAGAPEKSIYHAMKICDMALDMAACMDEITDPSKAGHMKIRVGIHSGSTVAGVVGIKMPRYCLFGDTVNTASRMETNSEANEIHISETTRHAIQGFPYIVEERGHINIKGKGEMKTYWLLGKEQLGEVSPKHSCPFTSLLLEELSKVSEPSYDKYSNHINHNSNSIPNTPRSDSRAMYSPVSFEDVQRTLAERGSLLNTPHHSPAHCPVNTNNMAGKGVEPKMAAGTDCTAKKQKHLQHLTPDMIKNEFNAKSKIAADSKVPNKEQQKSQTCFIL